MLYEKFLPNDYTLLAKEDFLGAVTYEDYRSSLQKIGYNLIDCGFVLIVIFLFLIFFISSVKKILHRISRFSPKNKIDKIIIWKFYS